MMNDLRRETIKRLFERQVMEMTRQTITQDSADVFDYQLSGGWIR